MKSQQLPPLGPPAAIWQTAATGASARANVLARAGGPAGSRQFQDFSRTLPVVYAPVFDRSLEESIGSAVPVVRDVPLIITEGNYLLLDVEGWREIRNLIDEIWYLDVMDDERQRRLVRRHEAFGKPHAEAEAWAKGSDQRNADIVDATRERADLIITLRGNKPSLRNNRTDHHD